MWFYSESGSTGALTGSVQLPQWKCERLVHGSLTFLMQVLVVLRIVFKTSKFCISLVVDSGGFCENEDTKFQEISLSLKTITYGAKRTLPLGTAHSDDGAVRSARAQAPGCQCSSCSFVRRRRGENEYSQQRTVVKVKCVDPDTPGSSTKFTGWEVILKRP